MDFAANQEPQVSEMLASIGVKSIEELWKAIPAQIRCPRPLQEDGLSESEILKLMQILGKKNILVRDHYLGAGAYEHYIPALVDAVCSKSEFLTAYTPYQAEASQGVLQAIFEYQSAICALTGMDVANASVYDGASACAEGLLMALRCQPNKDKVLVAGSLHPLYRSVIQLYLDRKDHECQIVPFLPDGQLDKEKLFSLIDERTAAVLLPYPNFFGMVEDWRTLIPFIKKKGSLVIVCANPLIYGLYASAADLGADIAVGDSQPFGLSLQFGGPYAGYMACRQELVRQLPGRIVGETLDSQGRRGFVLTLQAREQHIRREKATSNICTNQALASIANLVVLLWYGPEGIKKLALTNYQRASYLKEKLLSLPHVRLMNELPFLNEFVVHFGKSTDEVVKHFHGAGIEPGLSLERFFTEMKGYFLVAVTETKSKEDLDHYYQVAVRLFED